MAGANNLAPCKGCNDRAIGCHATCEAYDNFQEKHKEARLKERKANNCVIYKSDFTGTSPRPGKHRKTKGNKR